MPLKQLYQVLLEDYVTMREVDSQREWIPCRAERLHLNLAWDTTWRLARLPGLGSELVSFLYRLLHDLLPTKERQHRTNSATPNTCKLCEDNILEDY